MNQDSVHHRQFATEHEKEEFIKKRIEKRKRHRDQKSSSEKRLARKLKFEKKKKSEVLSEDYKPFHLVHKLLKEAVGLQKKSINVFWKYKDDKSARKFFRTALEKFDEASSLSEGTIVERLPFENLYRETVIQRKYLIKK